MQESENLIFKFREKFLEKIIYENTHRVSNWQHKLRIVSINIVNHQISQFVLVENFIVCKNNKTNEKNN